MELAKKPVLFLCIASADTFRISVPKTEHHYLFYRNQPYLVKFVLDIEFFDEHLMFDRYNAPEKEDVESETETDASAIVDSVDSETIIDDSTGQDSDSVPEEKEDSVPEENPELSLEDYKNKLQKMRKSDVREILKELNPKKTCPIRKENIIKEVLKAQRSK